jgi:carbonic anhydrase
MSGVAWLLELHLVHEITGGQAGSTIGSEWLVIGVFFFAVESAKSRAALPQIAENLAGPAASDAAGARRPRNITFNPNHCLPDVEQRHRFYRYEGALTSGQLDETVSWLAFERPVSVLEADLRPILAASDQDARPVEPLNRRIVLRSFA